MEHRNLQASVDALIAIKGMVGDALVARHADKPRPQLMRLTRLDLAYELKGLQHAVICHYLRCQATREALVMIRGSIEDTLQLFTDRDDEARDALAMTEPFRHHLYTSVTVAALRISERAAIRQKQDYWRHCKAMRIVPPGPKASAV